MGNYFHFTHISGSLKYFCDIMNLVQESWVTVLYSYQRGLYFNGGCASLLHVKRNQVSSVVHKLEATLKPAEIFYLSFSYGDGEFTTEGRYFNCHNEQKFPIL